MNPSDRVKIIFAGGGTGGHLFPALAIADALRKKLENNSKTDILFVGTKRGIEYRLRDTLGYPLHIIDMRGIARSLTLKNLLVPFVVITALFKSFLLLNKFKPDLIVGTGGYVCWPVLKMAGWRNIPYCLQEQNSFPGVTIRQLASKAVCVFLGFEKAKQYLNTQAKIVYSGNPVRSDITSGNRVEALNEFKLNTDKKTILILGGSQGARAINHAVLKSVSDEILKDKYQILWQTGKRDYKDVTVEAGNKVSCCSLFPFHNDMALVYAAADMVIARAGALTLAEITECNLPAVLIPYPHAASDHQKKNAVDYVERNMAVMIEEKNIDDENIIQIAINLFESGEAENIKNRIKTETERKEKAVDIISNELLHILNERTKNAG